MTATIHPTRRRARRRLPAAEGVGLMALFLGLAIFAPAATAQEAPADSLTVVMTEFEPFVTNDDGEADGFYAEIWDETASQLGVSYDIVWVDSFGELLPALADGRADVAVAPLAPTAEREAVFDFTSAVIASGPQLGYSDRLQPPASLLRSMFDSRVFSIGLVAIIGLLIMAHVIWLFERDRADDEGGDFDRRYLHGIWDGLWWSTVTTTTVGYGDKAPKSFGGRMIALVAMLSSVVLVAAFVSQITSIMAENRAKAPISSLSDVSGPVGVVAGSSYADFLVRAGVTTVQFDTQVDMFASARSGQVDVVMTNPFAMAHLGPSYDVKAVEGVLFEEFETFGLAQGSPWREPLNEVLADLQSSGEIAEIIKDALN